MSFTVAMNSGMAYKHRSQKLLDFLVACYHMTSFDPLGTMARAGSACTFLIDDIHSRHAIPPSYPLDRSRVTA